jgi:hypothetical protein
MMREKSTREGRIQTQPLISTYCLFLAIAKRQTDINYAAEIMTIDRFFLNQ